jgi:enamine deaminase RidA (YjgF/YER057c/UK114 family)
MPIERIQPQGLASSPRFKQVVKAGKIVFVAGQTALNAEGTLVGLGDISAQTAQVFENLKTALAAAGADFTHLTKLTVYATDAGSLPAIAAVRAQYLGTPDPVASTFVAIAGLAQPGFLVEIEAIAVLD